MTVFAIIPILPDILIIAPAAYFLGKWIGRQDRKKR